MGRCAYELVISAIPVNELYCGRRRNQPGKLEETGKKSTNEDGEENNTSTTEEAARRFFHLPVNRSNDDGLEHGGAGRKEKAVSTEKGEKERKRKEKTYTVVIKRVGRSFICIW